MDADALRRLAGATGFDLATLEKDVALTWLISGIYQPASSLANVLIFKGGTALRKIYFPEWRLSEDLDFTILEDLAPKEVRRGFEQVFDALEELDSFTYEITQFNANQYVIFGRIQFLGPLDHKNTIKLDISRKEQLVTDPANVDVEPDYEEIPPFTALIYSKTEILVEKLRSILQRGYARDYYDVWRLLREEDFDMELVGELLQEKCDITGVDYRPRLMFDDERLEEARRHWEPSLGRLTPDLPEFEAVMGELREGLPP